MSQFGDKELIWCKMDTHENIIHRLEDGCSWGFLKMSNIKH